MNPQIILTTSVLFPILAGLILFLFKKDDDKKIVYPVFGISLLVTALFVILLLGAGPVDITVFELMDGVAINFRLDNLGRFFLVIVSLVWVMAGLFSLEYIKHEKRQNRFFGFYLIIYGVLIGLGCSGNLITMYAFYEFMTICSVPIVLHNQKREAIMAALKFLFYSFFGAYMALFGIYLRFKYCMTVDFIPG
jgi:multicomponent Na+:H+ antiporter subunit D